MKHLGLALLLVASVGSAQESADFQPATTNVWGAQYPRVDGEGRFQVRIKAPEATQVRLNFWSGPKVPTSLVEANIFSWSRGTR